MNLELTSQSFGEGFFTKNLQQQLSFSINTKTVKKGRLLLFRRNHFFIQITLMSFKNEKESFEIPFPFKVETHEGEGLMYFDYRLGSLNTISTLIVPKKISSSYFNKILEIQVCR